ncbi:putative endonuclease [Brevibacillus phage SecTim467]|uniref:Putative endonuclease n=2 Tax=Jenstvirus jenst TaxID=1982225 RepID=A0A0K2CNR4_9CAUD|nr:endonuclease [Brevibacillus phage Jenst]ALA07266.1 putative intein-containing protein [Brevibacillus phage Jenst]ALA07467.1 putative endonuclease [Brevibacillus phage SecTim467]
MKVELTKELLTELYVNRALNFKEIAQETGWEHSWVRRKVISFGIPLRSKGHELTIEELDRLYNVEQKSTKEIAKLISRSQCYVMGKMKEFEIERRDSGTAQAMKIGIPFNENFFNEWSPEMAYVLGFIYADGNLSNNRFRIQIKDLDHIEKLADTLGMDRSYIFTRTDKKYGKESYGISASRRDVAARLIALGVTPNKSRSMTFPEIPKEYLRDFIRGYFDGDGTVGCYSKQLAVRFTLGAEKFAKRLAEILSDMLEHDVKIKFDKRGAGNYVVGFHSNRLAKKFYENIYYDNCLAMDRKQDVFVTHMPIPCSQ